MRTRSDSIVPIGLGIASLIPGFFGWAGASVALFVVGALIAGWHLHEAPARAGLLVSMPLALLVAVQVVRGGDPVDDVPLVTAAMSVVTVVAIALASAHVAAGTRRRLQHRRDIA